MTVEKFFSQNSPLSSVLGSFEPRPQQLLLARGIEYCLSNKKHYIAEAPTGVGKSMAYLAPTILWAKQNNKKVIVSTYTKVLQRQLFDKDLPVLHKAIGGFNYSLCLGGENYLCIKRLKQTTDFGLFDDNSDVNIIDGLLKWSRKTHNGTIYDIDFAVPSKLWKKVCRDHTLCDKTCENAGSCLYLDAVNTWNDSHILVTNHHICFYNIKMDWKLLPRVDAVVFDEAHEIEEVATAALGTEVYSSKIKSILDVIRRIASSAPAAKPAMKDLINNISSINNEIGQLYTLSCSGTAFLQKNDISHLSYLTRLLARMDETLKTLGIDAIKPYAEKIKDIAISLDEITNQDAEDGHVCWKSVSHKEWKVAASPIEVSGILKRKLFGVIPSVFLVSATMAVRNDLSFFKRRIGLNGDSPESILSSPFDYKKQAVIYIPNMPDPKHASYKESIIDEIEKILKIFKGRTLILFTSYNLMNEVYTILSNTLSGINFLKQGDAPGNKLVEIFKKSRNCVLLGANTFWQGVDIPGSALQCVIITKLPFLPPDDPVTIARQELLEKRGFNSFVFYQLPRAILLFKQGFGRLIRTQSDKGIVAILDSRIRQKKYGNQFIRALPECRIISDLSKIIR